MEAVRQRLLVVRGAFALAAMDATEPDVIVAARRISPLVVGTAPGETYLASDVPAILDRATAFYAVNDDEIVRLGPEGFRAVDLEGAPVRLHQLSIDWDLETAEKGGHDDFMSKEINEQPDAIRSTLLDRRRPTAPSPSTNAHQRRGTARRQARGAGGGRHLAPLGPGRQVRDRDAGRASASTSTSRASTATATRSSRSARW